MELILHLCTEKYCFVSYNLLLNIETTWNCCLNIATAVAKNICALKQKQFEKIIHIIKVVKRQEVREGNCQRVKAKNWTLQTVEMSSFI